MKFLFMIFLLFVLFVFVFGFSVLRMLFRGIFGLKSNSRPQNRQTNTSQKKQQPTPSSASKKIIASDEGEYVDYVEIKD